MQVPEHNSANHQWSTIRTTQLQRLFYVPTAFIWKIEVLSNFSRIKRWTRKHKKKGIEKN